MRSIPLFLTVLIVAVAPIFFVGSLSAVVSTFISFHFHLFGLSCVILFCPMIILLDTDRLRLIFCFDLNFDF